MKMDLTKKFNDLFSVGGNEQIFDQFAGLIDLSDADFDRIYPSMKERLNSLFSSEQFQSDVLTNLRLVGHGSIEDERAAAEEVLSDIENDDTLSENKKDILKTIIEGSVISIIKMIEVPRERIKVEIKKLDESAIIPEYAHKTDAGADVFALEETLIKPHETVLVKTGIAVAIPIGYEIQVRPRSGLSLKSTLRIANAPGTIDSDYRGEICVIMTNTGNLSYTINKGDKIAQLVIAPVPMIDWVEVKELSTTERGEGGFGSTDKK